jgi:hypothetical protein
MLCGNGHDAAPFRSLHEQTDASFSKRVRLVLGESEVIDGPSSPCLEGSNEKIRLLVPVIDRSSDLQADELSYWPLLPSSVF